MAINHPLGRSAGRASPPSGIRIFQRILLLIAAPLLFFGALEGSLRLFGFGKAADFFIPDGQPGFYRTNPDFTAPFIPASFGIQPLNFRIRKRKEPGCVRVFVLGESAAQGIPDPDFGLAAQLRAQLRARYPGSSFEVFNLGITAIDSHVVYRIVRDVAAFEPDLLVIYMGNNEVVGPYGPGCAYMASTPPVFVVRASAWARSMRTGQLLGEILARIGPKGSRARDWKGMETFAENSVRGDDPRMDAVYRNFSANLTDILDFAGREGVRSVVATVVANLKDSAPFISLNRSGMTADEARSWKAAADAGRIAWDLGDAPSAKPSLEEALRIDPGFAATNYRLGRLSEELGDAEGARRHYLAALHWDALRFRPDARLNDIIRRVARCAGESVILVDAARTMGSDPDSVGPLAGRDILFDHVHFNWAGNFRLALQLADACAKALPMPDGRGSWLDSAGCAAALGYTPQAELNMLRVAVQLMLRPPFTGQLNFSETQARLKKAVELADAQVNAPGAKSAYIAAVQRALQLDPENASLAARLGAMEADAGDLDGALSLFDRADALEPASSASCLRRAGVLARLRKYDDAEAWLHASLRLDPIYNSASRALVDLWTSTGQSGKGREFFAKALARTPSNNYLRLEYANLLSRIGDAPGAEREARAIWSGDPDSRPAMAALELLVRLYAREGRAADADALTLEARRHQADDYYNNQRLVRIYSARNDAAEAADCLLAMASSGPFDSAEHLDLAHRLADLDRGSEMLDELARARDVANVEGDDARMAAIGGVIAEYRRRFSDGQSR